MHKKFFLVLLSLLALVLTLSLHPVLAENQNKNKDDESFSPPEIEGTYDVPGHPNMKVRVFIYRAKGKGGGKPSPSPTPVPVLDCSLSDPNSSATDGVTGWHLNSSWSYNLNFNSVPSSVGYVNLQTIVANAFSTWTSAIPVTMKIEKGANTVANRAKFDRKNIIAWGRTSSSALAVTYTWYYTANNEVADVDTIMNNNYPWSWSGSATCAYPNSYDAQNILTHELGHWMGLDDMKTDEFVDNTMYGWGSTKEAKKDTLTTGDIAGLKTIY